MDNLIDVDFEAPLDATEDAGFPSVFLSDDTAGYRRLCTAFPFTYGFVLAGPYAEDVADVLTWIEMHGGTEGTDWARISDVAETIVEIRLRDEDQFKKFTADCLAPRWAARPPAVVTKKAKKSRKKKTADAVEPATDIVQAA
jgi:hypothetical protein